MGFSSGISMPQHLDPQYPLPPECSALGCGSTQVMECDECEAYICRHHAVKCAECIYLLCQDCADDLFEDGKCWRHHA